MNYLYIIALFTLITSTLYGDQTPVFGQVTLKTYNMDCGLITSPNGKDLTFTPTKSLSVPRYFYISESTENGGPDSLTIISKVKKLFWVKSGNRMIFDTDLAKRGVMVSVKEAFVGQLQLGDTSPTYSKHSLVLVDINEIPASECPQSPPHS